MKLIQSNVICYLKSMTQKTRKKLIGRKYCILNALSVCVVCFCCFSNMMTKTDSNILLAIKLFMKYLKEGCQTFIHYFGIAKFKNHKLAVPN